MPSSINWGKWGLKAMAVSDFVGHKANAVGSTLGVERFWPTTGDYILELEKCERILRTFTVEGLPTQESAADGKTKRKVYRKVPPKVIQEAKGIVIFNSMRSGIAPFGGAGGGGIIVVRMKDGSWSAPSFISPNNLSAGFMIGLDVYQCILILRTEAAVQGFRTHNLTIGSEIAVAAGPLGYGVSGETGLKSGGGFKTPIFSYVLSKGLYAGVEVVGQAFLDRFDENERVYYWPGIKAGDIFDGKVRRPHESDKLYAALRDAELGTAQGASLEWDTEDVTTLDLDEGEVLKLPPTPEQLMVYEAAGIQDEEDVKFEEEERKAVRALPPPPRHPHARNSKARISDSSILNGRTAGMRSPSTGKSAGECNSPNPEEDGDTNAQYTTAPDLANVTPSRFAPAPPPRHPSRRPLSNPAAGRFMTPAPEPLHVPPIQTADGRSEEEIVAEGQQAGMKAIEEAEAHDVLHETEPQREGLEIPAALTTGMQGLGLNIPPAEHSASEPLQERAEILIPPPLHHQDSNTSGSSFYSEASETTIPPAYEGGEDGAKVVQAEKGV